MKQFRNICLFTLMLTLILTGCSITSPTNKEFREQFEKDWEESTEQNLEDYWTVAHSDEAGKDHYWKVLDADEEEVCTITNEDQVKQVDDLLSDDGTWRDLTTEAPDTPAYTYIFCQQETQKAGQPPETRVYEDLVSFTISTENDTLTLKILEDLPTLLGADLNDLLTVTTTIPSETAEALRNPTQFAE